MKHTILILLLLIKTSLFYSQTIIAPNYALKSHETLIISKIDVSREKTVVYLSIENRIAGGQFCADRNIFIINPDGTRNKLTSSSGIPICPNTYNFKTIGEKLDFILTFPALKTGKERIVDDKGFYKTNPLLSLIIAIALFSLAGVPPTAGFFGKFFLLMAGADKGNYWLITVSALTLIVYFFYSLPFEFSFHLDK